MTVTVADVGEVTRAHPAGFDAILLDVDNGPEGMTRAANDALYGPRGLTTARAALRPGGCSPCGASNTSPLHRRPDPRRIHHPGSPPRARHGKGGKHTVWTGRKGG